MLHVFRVMLHVFFVTLQETRATLHETLATLHETRATLHDTRATLHAFASAEYTKPSRLVIHRDGQAGCEPWSAINRPLTAVMLCRRVSLFTDSPLN